MKHGALSIVVGAAFALSVVTQVPGVAAAASVAAEWPKKCSYQQALYRNGAEAICRAGSGHYKALVNCRPLMGGNLINREASVWRKVGSNSYSYVGCPPMSNFMSAGIMTKAG